MYLPGIDVSDDIVSLCGDGPAWKSPYAELLQHTSFQKNIYIWEGKLFITCGPSRYFYVLLLESSKLVIHLLKAIEHRFIYIDPHVIRRALPDVRQCWGSYFRYITTESDELTQKRCNSSALFFLIAELEIKFLHWKKNTNLLPPETSTFGCYSWIKSIIYHYFPAGYFDRLLTLESENVIRYIYNEANVIT